MPKMRRIARVVIAIALVAVFAIAIWAYPQLPARVPTHWNAAGEVDGYSGRAFGGAVPNLAMWFITVPTLGAALVSVVYSYLIYQRIVPKNGMNGPPAAGA